MTQFMLISGEIPENILERLGLKSISIDRSTNLLKKIANQLFTEEQLRLCWYPESLVNRSVHDLFSDAQINLQEGMSIEKTLVGKLFLEISPVIQKIVIWYSTDFYDLQSFTNIKLFIENLSFELSQESGEVYLRFSRFLT